MTTAQAALVGDFRLVIIIVGVLASLLLLLMIRLPAALLIICLIWFLAWTAGAI